MEIKVYNNIFENEYKTFTYNPDKPLLEQLEDNLDVNYYKDTLVECYDSETGETFYAPLEDEDSNSSVVIVANGINVDETYEPKETDIVSVFFTPASSGGGGGKYIGAIIGAVVGAVAFGVMIYASGGLAAATLPTIIQATSIFASCVGLGFAIGAMVDMKSQNLDNKSSKLNGGKEGASNPDVRGAENTSILNDSFPFVVGKHLITPRVIGDPVTSYSGRDGEDAYIKILLLAGYAPLKLTDFKLGDFWLSYNRDHPINGGTVAQQTIINGLLRGYSSGGVADNGDILDYWKNNDISLEIIQQNPNVPDVDYGTVYPYAVDDQSINANVLYIADKALDQAAVVAYKGASFPNKFRTNGVWFTTPCPRKFTINIQFPSGFYETYTKTENDVTNTIYGSVPLWVAIQWRIINVNNASSDPNGADYDSWNNIAVGNLLTFSTDRATADKNAHKGNDLSTNTIEQIYQNWLGKQLNSFGDYSGEQHLSEIRLSATVELSKAQCKQVIADTNPSKMIEVRVIRVSPNYMNQTSTAGLPDNEGLHSYSDLVKVVSIVTETFDEQELRVNDNLVPTRPLSEKDMRTYTLVAIKAKADASGYIINQLKKINCIAESFSPYWDSTEKKMYPEGVTKKIKYYGYYDEHGNKVNRSDDAIEQEVTKAQYEEGRQEGFSWYQEDAGSTFVDIIKNIVFNNAGTHNDRPCTILNNLSSLYNNNSVASGFMLACVGPQNGTVALGYDEINILSIGDWAEQTAALEDGTTFNSDTVYNGIQYHKNDIVPLRMESNGYITAGIKLESLLEKLAVAGRALWCIDETGKIKVVMDRPCDYVKGVISAQNCISSSNAFSYEKQPAGLFISFNDENDGYDKNQVYCWSDGNSLSNYHGEVEPFNIDFVTNPYQVWSLGRYMLAYRILTKEMLTRKIGVEGNTYSIGDVVLIQSEDLLIGDTSGRVQEILEENGRIYGFITDAPYDYAAIISDDGNSTQGVTILQPGYLGKSKTVTLPISKPRTQTIGGIDYTLKKGTTNLVLIGALDPARPTIYGVLRSSEDPSDGDVVKYNMKNGDIVMFGERDKISAPYRIVKIKPEKDGGFSETLVSYNEGLYNAGRMLPAFQSYITNPPVEDMLVSLSDVPTNLKELNDSRKSIQNSINTIINGGTSIGAPDVITGLTVTAEMSNVAISWTAPVNNGLRNTIKKYIVDLSKDGGLNWITVANVYKSSFEYIYDRTNIGLAVNKGAWEAGVAYNINDVVVNSNTKYICTSTHTSGETFDETEASNWTWFDGYMEAEDFTNWRVRVKAENVYGNQSGWSMDTLVNTSHYGTYKPCLPAILANSCQASRDEISVKWNYSFTREPYASNVFKAYLYKDTDEFPMTIISNEYANYVFNRAIDGYPERSDLRDWTVKIVCYNSIYGETSLEAKWSTASSVGYTNYGTWQLPKPVVNVKVTDRTAILKLSLSSRADNVIPYGDIRYKVYIKRHLDESVYNKPATDLDPYPVFDSVSKQCIKDNENNYKVQIVIDVGEWHAAVTYNKGDLVSVDDSNTIIKYVCKEDHVSGSDFDETEQAFWEVYDNQIIDCGTWTASTEYNVNNLVVNDNVTYVCLTAHTSGSEFDDIEKGYWEVFEDFVVSYDTYVQTLPLKGQGINQLENTTYDYKVFAFNEAGESSEYTEALVTALCTNIRDIVKAKQTDKELYISELSALSANIGAILEGSLGDSSNIWDLSTFIDDNGIQHYKGKFRVGDENEYLLVDPILDEMGIPTGRYKISFKMGSFEVTTEFSRINGELIVMKNEESLDRTRITPEGTFYEHRGSLHEESPWEVVAKQETRGLMSQSVYSYDSLVISNMSIKDRRALGHDVGKPYLSDNAICYHFDTDDEVRTGSGNFHYVQEPVERHIYDHKGRTLFENGGEVTSALGSDNMPKLVDEADNTTGSPIDFKPAILSFSPYSEIGKALYGGYNLTHPLGNMLWTVDFWIEYIWAEDQTLFDVGNEGDRIQIIISPGDPYYNTYKNRPDPETGEDDPPYNYEVEYSDLLVYNNVMPSGEYIYHVSGTWEEHYKLWEDYGVKFDPNTWLHFGFVLTNDEILFYVGTRDEAIRFTRRQSLNTPGTAIFNQEKNSFCLDELYIDTVPETFESFRQTSLDKIPWGNIPYSEKNFILDVKDLNSFYTNIFGAQIFVDAVKEVVQESKGITVYDTVEDAEADLSNLEEGQIVATEQGGAGVSNEVKKDDIRPVTSNAVANSLSYSTEEIKTGGTWIDGKPIYRKTYYSATNWANTTVIDTIANLDSVVTIKDLTSLTTGAVYQNYGNDGSAYSIAVVDVSTGAVTVMRGGAFINNLPSSVTIEYTKTTD